MGWYRTSEGREVFWSGTIKPQSWIACYLIRLAAWMDGVTKTYFSTQDEIRYRQFSVKVDDYGHVCTKDMDDPTNTWHAVWRIF